MESERAAKFYNKALGMVLWGEKEEDVFRMLEVNGIIEGDAELIYKKARKERVLTIRGTYFKKAAFGLVMIVGGIALFAFFWMIIGVMFRPILIMSGLLCLFGAYKLLDGGFGIFFAPYKEGSVTEEF